jgi:outer membrane protein OmpA-like peptidoglycan-associated protein
MILLKKHRVWYGTMYLFGWLLAACSSPKVLVVLLQDEHGATGAVAVGEGAQATILQTPLSAAHVTAQGRITQAVMTQEAVARTFATTLAAQPPTPLSFLLYFEEGSTRVMAESQATLAALFAEVARRQAVEVQVTGHTDRVGSEDYNDRLSLQRAEAIRDMLISAGLHASFLRTVGRGEREPLVPTPDEQSEPRNRRVEVIVR